MSPKDILADLILAENLVQIIAEKEYPSMREMARAAKRSLPALDKAIQLIRTEIVETNKSQNQQRICNDKKT